MNYDYKVAWCHVCNQGWIEIVKEKETNKLFFFCSECELEWKTIDDVLDKKSGIFNEDGGKIIIPNNEDIINSGLDKYILKK